ncbi:DMT family transporter [bacterium]|nr:DMT family transporter [bacterium]
MGILFILGYVLIVGIGTFLMKFAMKDLSSAQINFLMSIGMLLIAVPMLWLSQKNFAIPTKALPLGIAIGLSMAIGSVLFVFALQTLEVGTASVLATGYIVVAFVLSVIFLRESLDLVKIVGFILAMIGLGILTFKTS